ncbi:MAG: FtsX-like permease family protein [Acidobacteriota bacterium]
MRPPSATPLAWLSLIHDRQRLVAAVGGVAFAVVLMLLEMGFLFAIYDSSTLSIEAFDADLILTHQHKDDINPSKPFPLQRLDQARGVPGVADIYPVYQRRLGAWRNLESSRRDLLRVLAFDPRDPVFEHPEIDAQRSLLLRPDTALVDRRYRDTYGGLRSGSSGELDGRRIQLVGDFEMGPDLQLNANLVMSDRTYRNCFNAVRRGGDILDDVEYGLVQVEPGHRPAQVRRALVDRLPSDVRVHTPEGLTRTIHRFWTIHQPVGAVFALGLLVGFAIGVMICYQILFTDVHDNLPQFATVKAMGYGNGFLVRLALRRGVYLALLACVLGLPLGLAGYAALGSVTGLTFRLTAGRAALVAGATIVMCALASLLAMRKALALDPAEVY